MSLRDDYPNPAIMKEAYVSSVGYSATGTALATLDDVENHSTGTGTRSERRYQCPFCGATERSFHVNTETGAFNCKRASCGVKGCLREFWPRFESRRFTRRRNPNFVLESELPVAASSTVPHSTVAKLGYPDIPALFTHSETTARPSADKGQAVIEDRSNWRQLWEGSVALERNAAQKGRDYLVGRGVSIEVALMAGVRFCRNWAPSTEGKVYVGGGAVLFPLTNREREVVAVEGRYVSPVGPKTRIGGDGSHGVFRALVNDQDPLTCERPFLVEGPVDALALAMCGAPAIAMHGVNLPDWLPAAIAFKAPLLAPDSDEGGKTVLPRWQAQIVHFALNTRTVEFGAELKVKDFGEMLKREGGVEQLRAWLLRLEPQCLIGDLVSGNSSVLPSIPQAPAPAIPAELEPKDLARAARDIQSKSKTLWNSMHQPQRLQAQVCAACLSRGIPVPQEWEVWAP